MSTTLALWSPDAVARSLSSRENVRSITALVWTRKPRYTSENGVLSSFADSSSRIRPSSSPMATREFARGCQLCDHVKKFDALTITTSRRKGYYTIRTGEAYAHMHVCWLAVERCSLILPVWLVVSSVPLDPSKESFTIDRVDIMLTPIPRWKTRHRLQQLSTKSTPAYGYYSPQRLLIYVFIIFHLVLLLYSVPLRSSFTWR